jgi:hypothetical protein
MKFLTWEKIHQNAYVLNARKRRKRKRKENWMRNQKGFKMNIKEMVKDHKRVKFSFYRDRELWYITEDGFEFPVPIEEVGNATFMAEDRAILFMRYIRKHMEMLDKARKEHKEALSVNTLGMMDQTMKNLAQGIAGEPVNLEGLKCPS